MSLAGEVKEIVFLMVVVMLGSYLLVVFAATPFGGKNEPSIVSCAPTQSHIDYTTRNRVTVTFSDGSTSQVSDYCARPYELQKHYCDPNGNLFQLRYECPGACRQGRCVNTCTDSDSGVATKRGVVSFNDRVYVDVCVGESQLKEFSCSNTQGLVTEVISCPAGTTCTDGACR